MAYHHIAVVTRDMAATHEFYAGSMGFELVKVEKAQTPAGGWAKHFFYDTGDGELMAFWELHDNSLPDDYRTAIATGLGLPQWTNHIAFDAADEVALQGAKQRLLDAGHDVMDIDHGWCHSVYATDPNGIMVEFCQTTAAFSKADKDQAFKALTCDDIEDSPPPKVMMHRGAS
jgi:catechol 2,3-dioxygenase-like lactoylglutathione lyase family enzyme